jgi:hypothetical protein
VGRPRFCFRPDTSSGPENHRPTARRSARRSQRPPVRGSQYREVSR